MLYSVPSAIVLRRWASREVEPKRRLLLRNAGPTALHFRLVLPQSDAFSLSGALLAAASAGGSSVGALAAGGTATLSVELARDRAPRQLVDELQVSTREGVLHIPHWQIRIQSQVQSREEESLWSGGRVRRETRCGTLLKWGPTPNL